MWPLIKLLPKKTNVPFVSMARLFATLSILAVIATGVGTVWPGVNLGIDFKGGTVLEFNTGARTADLAKVRNAVSGLNLGDVQVQRFGADNDAVVRFQTPAGVDAGVVATKVKGAISSALGQVTFPAHRRGGPGGVGRAGVARAWRPHGLP